ncbi:MAG: hypothetical protein PHN39_02930 [Candidatus Pacebacteria bacterium]|nr:hypothetical protein [Candidatus Paceibacterota bacterium]
MIAIVGVTFVIWLDQTEDKSDKDLTPTAGDLEYIVVNANAITALFALYPSDEALDEALSYYREGSEGLECVDRKSSYIIERAYSCYKENPEIKKENVLVELYGFKSDPDIIFLRAEIVSQNEAEAETVEVWKGERTLHAYTLKFAGGSWRINGESWNVMDSSPLIVCRNI